MAHLFSFDREHRGLVDYDEGLRGRAEAVLRLSF